MENNTHAQQDTQKAFEDKGPMLPYYYDRNRVPESFRHLLANVDRTARDDLDAIKKSREIQEIKTFFPDVCQWIDANRDKALYASFVCFAVYDAARLIKTVYLQEQGGKPSLFDFAGTGDGKSRMSEFFSHVEEREGCLHYRYNIRARRPGLFTMPLDKWNSYGWGTRQDPDDGIFSLRVRTGPKGPGPAGRQSKGKKRKSRQPPVIPSILCTIDFSTVEADFPLVKRLTNYDKRVCCSVCSILDAGQWVMSIDEIYFSMGYTGTPSGRDRKKINQSLTKMSARAHIDNRAEIAAGSKYEPLSYDGDFIFFERITGTVNINGKEIRDPVHVLQYPRIIDLAKRRGQFLGIPMAVLQSGISKTEGNLAIEDYLIQRISEAKIKRQPAKIRWETMYKRLDIEGKTERQRMRNTAKDYMQHYKETGWIDSFKAERDGLSFEFP